MSAAPQLETFAGGVETAVDVPQIERQLRDLWQLAADSDANHRITRACLFNLVAYCESAAARDHATGMIREVTSRHPCRAIVLLADPASTVNELGAAISAHCHLAAGGGKQVCCEQISIHAAGLSVQHLPGAVLPLLESDLPTVIWWQGNFTQQTELFRRLHSVADRVIFDSAMADNVTPDAQLADLNWTRLAFWQQLIAEAFDDPQLVAALPEMEEIVILHGTAAGARRRAQLLAGWIGAQLGWRPAQMPARTRLSCSDDGDAAGVGLLTVVLRGAGNEVIVRKNHGEQSVSVTVNRPDACGLPRTRGLWPTDDATLLCQELDQPSHPAPYLRAWELAAAL